MKRLLSVGMLLLVCGIPVLAAKNSAKFELLTDVRVGDARLPAGPCEVSWGEETGSQVQLSIKTTDRKTVVVRANVIGGVVPHTGVVTSVVDGVTHLKGFRTKTATFTIEPESVGTK